MWGNGGKIWTSKKFSHVSYVSNHLKQVHMTYSCMFMQILVYFVPISITILK